MSFINKLKFWIVDVSRGYSLPMSILNWLVIFLWCAKYDGNLIYGFLALIGLACAQLGANVFDDYIDHRSGTPKQECKTFYLTEGLTTPETIFKLAIFYFAVSGMIGLFLTVMCGYQVLILAAIGGLICLVYPKLNNYCLGELAVGAAFGPLMFVGVNFVMLQDFDNRFLFVSLPIALFTVLLLVAHALMDFDFDVSSGKKTFCTVLGTKERALKGIMALMIIAFALTIFYSLRGILPVQALYTLLLIPSIFRLNKSLKEYISTTEPSKDAFMKNFKLARNIASAYNIILIIIILFFI